MTSLIVPITRPLHAQTVLDTFVSGLTSENFASGGYATALIRRGIDLALALAMVRSLSVGSKAAALPLSGGDRQAIRDADAAWNTDAVFDCDPQAVVGALYRVTVIPVPLGLHHTRIAAVFSAPPEAVLGMYDVANGADWETHGDDYLYKRYGDVSALVDTKDDSALCLSRNSGERLWLELPWRFDDRADRLLPPLRRAEAARKALRGDMSPPQSRPKARPKPYAK